MQHSTTKKIHSHGLITLVLACSVLTVAHAEDALPAGYVAPNLPVIPPKTYTLAPSEPSPDGKATITKALQGAIDAAAAAGGGIVELPAGEYLCGPIRLSSNIRLQLAAGAMVRMVPRDKYPGGPADPADFISGDHLHDIAIGGAGTIDGQGGGWWPDVKKDNIKRPRMIHLSACERVLIEKVTLQNSPMFHIAIGGKSQHVTVRGVTIRAPASTGPVNPSHNTDACDVSGQHVLIQDCDVSVGDDNFTCGGGTSDVLITHCTYGFGHGVSIGSYTKGGVSNITVTDCTFTNTEFGIRIKSDRDRGGIVENLAYRNLRMTNVGCPIMIYGTYTEKDPKYRKLNELTPEIAATFPAKPIAEHTPIFRDIIFSNITATVPNGKRAGLIWGLPEAPVSNVLIENVTITADKPFGIFSAQNVRVVNSKIVTPNGFNKLSTGNAQVTVSP